MSQIPNQTSSHRRRTSTLTTPATGTLDRGPDLSSTRPRDTGYSSAWDETPRSKSDHMPPSSDTQSMTLDRSPVPQQDGGWALPGLSSPRQDQKPSRSPAPNVRNRPVQLDDGNGSVTWDSAKSKSAEVRGYAAHSSSSGYFTPRGLFRKLSVSLPKFQPHENGYADKDKLGRSGRMPGTLPERIRGLAANLGRGLWRLRAKLMVLLGIALTVVLFYQTPLHRYYLRSPWLGGGKRFVLILAANPGGGVMEWKKPTDFAIERDSIKNKKNYVARWGYELEIVDMAIKKRYAHEWRESWEKVDTIRRCLRDYPEAEWFWWLDLNTVIMEPSLSLQKHIFDDLAKNTYRDINVWNPLKVSHPFPRPGLDEESRSPVGDNNPSSIDMIVPQDCSGFNLGSFFMRRSEWTERLLDVWWDPVHYEQRHMDWEHKEQSAFEYLYKNQPWVRTHTAFIQQRKINSFPAGACGDGGNESIHYRAEDRDFVVNMAGCEWGRDCWGEMYDFRELSNRLNRSRWQKIKDGIRGLFHGNRNGG